MNVISTSNMPAHLDNATQVVVALSALAQVTRLNIFRALVQAGGAGMAAGDLAQRLAVAPSGLSFHLKELLHARLIEVTQQGRFMIYRANYAQFEGLLRYLTENCCQGAVACSDAGKQGCEAISAPLCDG